MQGETTAAMSNNAPNNTFKLPKSKGLNRPTTWFGASSFGSNRTSSSSSSSSGSSSQTITLGGSGLAGSSASGSGLVQPTTTTASRGFSRTSNQAGLSSPSPFASSAHSFQSPFPSSKGKHRLSPSPSPRHTYGEDDFVMISPIRPPPFPSTANPTYANQSFNIGSTSSANSMMRSSSGSASSSSSPAEDSPTPACGVANATARLKLADDDSPIRKVPGQSRSLARGPKDEGRNIFSAAIKQGIRRDVPTSPLKQMTTNTMRSMDDPEEEDNDGSPRLSQMPLGNGPPVPPRQPLFPPLRASQSQDCDGATSKSRSLFHNANQSGTGRRSEESRIPRLSTSHPIRARSSTEVDRPTLGQKKAVSLDAIPISSGSSDEPFGHPIPPASTLGKKSRPSSSTGISGLPGREGRAHKRINSGEYHNLASAAAGSISRSMGQKSGLALSLTPSPAFGTLPDFNHSSNSSLSSLSTNTTNLTPTTSAFSPAEPPIFEDVKPLAEAFEQPAATVSRKFKPRDSGVSMSGDEETKTKSILIPPPSVMKPNRGFLLAGTGVKPKRPAMLKRTSSMGNDRYERPLETPIMGPGEHTGWPALAYNANTNNANAFDFLGEGAAGLGIGTKGASGDAKPSMPGTPVKKHAYGHSHGGGPFGHHKVGHSMSQPSLNADTFDLGTRAGNEQIMGRLSLGAAVATTGGTLTESSKVNLAPGRGRRNTLGQSSQIQLPLPPMSVKKPQVISVIPHLTLTSTSSPGSPSPGTVDADMSSPTVRVSSTTLTASSLRSMDSAAPVERVSLLRRLSNGAGSSESEEEGTPTKGGGDRTALGQPVFKTPTPSPGKSHLRHAAAPPSAMRNPSTNHSGQGSIMPRLSLPAFANPKVHRTLHHRQSHPATYAVQAEEEDLFEKRFITLEQIGKGAFSTVIKVQDRDGDGLYAVKKARGVFDGVKDRLRHLEEVDILRLLSKTPCKHVIHFEDAWEQNRQLYIQTELCLGSLAFFLEEYGRVVERLDEGRVWKIVRELSDGINHIHSNGVIHFDIKPANILISGTGSLKIGDFGLATRWPRVHPSVILEGSGLGGVVPTDVNMEKLEREGDRVYMPPEMLRGVFVKAADVFSFGLVVLEVSTNICVPDGGAPWQALRTNDFTVVDLSPLSPALTDLITSCMHSDPSSRPCIDHIVSHPIVQRARNGKDALAPEDPRWLVDVLSGGSGFGFSGVAAAHDGDIVMAD